MLKRKAAAWLMGLFVLAAMAGCRKVHAPPAPPAAASASATAAAASTDSDDITPLSEWTVSMVTARNVGNLGDVRGTGDRFWIDGKIFAQATMKAKPGAHAGSHTFEMKWFDGLNVVAEQKAVYEVKNSPFFVVASASGHELGAGDHRVELFADGRYLGSTQFTVVQP